MPMPSLNNDQGIPTLAIIGIVALIVILLVIIMIVLFSLGRKRRKILK